MCAVHYAGELALVGVAADFAPDFYAFYPGGLDLGDRGVACFLNTMPDFKDLHVGGRIS